jgi:hypothetical protein
MRHRDRCLPLYHQAGSAGNHVLAVCAAIALPSTTGDEARLRR